MGTRTEYYDLGSQSLRTCKITSLPNLVNKVKPERVNTGISFPCPLLETVDRMRGDVTRTRFIQRVLEKHIAAEQGNENENGNIVSSSTTPSASQVGRHEERQASAMLDSLVCNNTDDKVQEVPLLDAV